MSCYAAAMTIRDFIHRIGGRAVIAQRLGVSNSSVREAERKGLFPSSWYVGMRQLGVEQGVHVPEELFSWRTVA